MICKRQECQEEFTRRKRNQVFCDAYCQREYNQTEYRRKYRREMSNNESDFKKIFCDSVHKQKGFTFKIAMSTMSGLPDIYCVYPGFIPVLLEAKWLKDIPENGKFKRKIPYRPLQREHLNNTNKVLKGSGWGLIGIDCGEKKYCGLLPPEVEIVTHDYLIDPDGCVPIVDGNIDVNLLFEGHVPYLQQKTCLTSGLPSSILRDN